MKFEKNIELQKELTRTNQEPGKVLEGNVDFSKIDLKMPKIQIIIRKTWYF